MHLDGLSAMQHPVRSCAIAKSMSASTGLDGSIANPRRKDLNSLEQKLSCFVSIDWGTESHRVVFLNPEGEVTGQYDAAHSGKGLEALIERLDHNRRCPRGEVGIAIEVSWCALVETLVERGFSVFAINPKQVDRFRDRYTVAGAKDDSREAHVLASALLIR
jgi:Transposase